MLPGFDHLPNVLGREEAGAILQPFKDKIIDVFDHGWNSYWRRAQEDPELMAIVLPRTRASFVHDFAIHRAREHFDKNPKDENPEGIRTQAEFGSLLVCFGEDLVLRFKKFGEHDKASSSSTRRQYEFDRQCLNLPGIPADATKVTAGYTLNREQTEIIKVSVSCYWYHTHLWSIPLSQKDDGTMSLAFPTPDQPDQPKKSIVKPKIRGKKTGEGDQ